MKRFALAQFAWLAFAAAPVQAQSDASASSCTSQCSYTWADGSKYVGGMKDGLPNESGTLFYTDGSKLACQFEEGSPVDQCVYTKPDGNKISGHLHWPYLDRNIEQATVHYPFWDGFWGRKSSVLVSLIVLEDGSVTGARAARPSDHPAMDEAAAEGVAKWRYKPAIIEGRPIRMPYFATVQFAGN